MRVSSHEVIPVSLDSWWPAKVHFAERGQPGHDISPAVLESDCRWSMVSEQRGYRYGGW